MNPVFIPWAVEMGLITWRDVRYYKRAPFPSEVLATFAVFGALSLVPADSDYHAVAVWLGWGFVVATFLSAGTPGNKSSFSGLITNPTNIPGKPGASQPPGTQLA